ncbi:MAG: GTP-binding protein, partial [Candidatus Helarchaeota archaeon]|nr:GTP-binding protein [Candidatus Helarchaeota archaeon]
MGGDGGIGKTTLSKVFCDSPFMDYLETIGVDIHVKDIQIDGVDGKLQIWDLSGQEHFRFMLPEFFKKSNGIILGFEVHRIQSFQNLGKWITMFKLSQPQIPIFLIGTKLDLGYHPALTREMVLDYVKEFNLVGYVETSAKEHINVGVPFRRILEHVKGFQPGTGSIIFLSEEGEETFAEMAEEPEVMAQFTSTEIPERSVVWPPPAPEPAFQPAPPVPEPAFLPAPPVP